MYAQVTRLQCWKSEHNDQSCEDAYAIDLAAGLLAVADGVGTTLFSNIWARHLVDHFLATPLLSEDPFEVEWWLRAAQEQFQQSLPALDGMPWNVMQKVQNEGSFSTLATVRVVAPGTVAGASVQAQMLVFGDTCIFIHKAAASEIIAFPLEHAADFDQPPISLPSKLSAFHRHFQRGVMRCVELEPGDRVLLATDAVARWIVDADSRAGETALSAFQTVAEQTTESWPGFIAACRTAGAMGDDDSTAIVLSLSAQADETSELVLGMTPAHQPELRASRKAAFLQAVQEQNKELAAVVFGDGQDLEQEGVFFPEDQWQMARQVADALREVLTVLRREINGPQAVKKITPVWRKYAHLLLDEPCAAAVCKTLTRLGIALEAPQDPASFGLSPAPAPPAAMQVVVKSQEQLQLELALIQALRSNDDMLIVEASADLQSSPYVSSVSLSRRDQERILQAAQREQDRLRVQRAIGSKYVDQIALASDLMGRNLTILSQEERQIVLLAQQWMDVRHDQNERAKLEAVEAILHSPYHEVLLFPEPDKKYVEQLLQKKQYQAAPLTAKAMDGGVPAISEYWFRKVCAIKRVYLLHWVYQKMSDVELEQTTLDDLINAPLIQEGIRAVNSSGAAMPLLPDILLPDIWQAFKSDPMVNYERLLQGLDLTEGQLKDILLIFLNRQLFEDYLLWEKSTQLEDWLQAAHGYAPTEFRQRLEQACPWVTSLRWWKG
ncbi:protein phosphatase 2C domain-containing protein [Dictyobacter kobayashii]|uniref:PPM-type phosphatase domain-containing protein n=1 Tax=Dictyobacter kobayashii TaxID=2014872 RepID=A0A402AHL2_9CHLR|nr:protein phosphatase 2C domain-containing protein [Dictyobacter kobayashii]GCE18589.1 hypothetical protein KDK_23890 [Dictyobacter kobayashii]